MRAEFVLEVAAAIAAAVAVVRYWKVILAGIAVVFFALAALGLMTVLDNWPLKS